MKIRLKDDNFHQKILLILKNYNNIINLKILISTCLAHFILFIYKDIQIAPSKTELMQLNVCRHKPSVM